MCLLARSHVRSCANLNEVPRTMQLCMSIPNVPTMFTGFCQNCVRKGEWTTEAAATICCIACEKRNWLSVTFKPTCPAPASLRPFYISTLINNLHIILLCDVRNISLVRRSTMHSIRWWSTLINSDACMYSGLMHACPCSQLSNALYTCASPPNYTSWRGILKQPTKLHQLKGNLEAADQVFARVVQFPPHDQLDLNHVIRERISKFITCITILSEAVSELSNY